MFIGNMVTEAIPARVYALYKIANSKKEISRSELQGLMEPAGIYEGNSYFSTILKAATELKLVALQDNMVILLVNKEQIKNMEDFRLYVISRLNSFDEEQFFKCTNVIVNMNEEIYKYPSLSDLGMLNYVSSRIGQQITAPMARGWRFWAQFLGFGYIYDMTFLPNAYVFVKNVLKLMELEKKREYAIDDFMIRFNQFGKILAENKGNEKHMNIALSNALRELHENGEIELVYSSDALSRWILYPSKEAFNEQVASIIFKGVRR